MSLCWHARCFSLSGIRSYCYSSDSTTMLIIPFYCPGKIIEVDDFTYQTLECWDRRDAIRNHHSPRTVRLYISENYSVGFIWAPVSKNQKAKIMECPHGILLGILSTLTCSNSMSSNQNDSRMYKLEKSSISDYQRRPV